MGEQTETSRYYPDGTVRLPDALEAWVDSVMEGDKGDDPDQRLTWDQVRAADPDDLNEDAICALLDALDAVPRSEHNRECNDLTSQHMDYVTHLSKRNAHLLDRAERAERELERVKQEKAGMTHRAYRILPNDDIDGHPGETWREFAADADMARIEAERERDALKADAERYRELRREWSAALSADADADAEPERDPYGVAGPCEPEPSRAEGGERTHYVGDGCPGGHRESDEPEPDCKDHKHSPSFGRTRECPKCGRYTFPPTSRPDAERGRPREADPQGDSPSTDASVDGGGDDGRSRAIEAALLSDPDPDCHYGIPRLRDFVARAIDAALASGGVVTREDALHERWWGNAHFADWQRERDRVRELEAALHDLLYANDVMAAVRRGDVVVVTWQRARDVLHGGS